MFRPNSPEHGAPARAAELTYRPDIDGLRALAVVLVVLFHLQIRQVPGGFIGVDVFFVISGYLLTAIIAKEIATSRFSIAGFYERRARRILPALIATLVPVTLLALVFLLPGELIAYAKSLLGATFSYSNVYFWSTADYFDAPAQSKPLLHTWSLAVEEQFYVVLPLLLLVLARRWPQARNGVVLGLTAASFGLSAWAAYEHPVSAFYLPFGRAWELLMGSILALNILPAIKSRWLRETAALAGIGMIACGALKLTNSTPFPGVAALLPCVGSLLVLGAGRYGSSAVGKALSLRPVVFIGLISYSVYLWHWPLIVFTKMGLLPVLPQRIYDPAIIVLSLVLGTLSWQFVEKPFRVGAFRAMSRPRLFGTAAGALGVCAGAAFLFISMSGFESRFPRAAVEVADLMNVPQQTQMGSCFITSKYRFEEFRPDLCLQIDPAKKNYLLLGDSHAAALWYGLSQKLTGSHILQANVSGCMPRIDASGSRDCRRMMAFMFGQFLPTHPLNGLLLSARWWTAQDFGQLAKTIGWCAQHKLDVTIIGPVMEYDAPLPKLLAYSLAFHDSGLMARHARSEMLDMDRAMQRKATVDWHARYVSLMRAQCPNSRCLDYADSAHTVALLADDNHLSNAGSVFMAQTLLAQGDLSFERRSATNTGATVGPATAARAH